MVGVFCVIDLMFCMECVMLCDGVVLVIGCDEVGCGVIVGLVVVGLSVFDGRFGGVLRGLCDLKMLSEVKCEELYLLVGVWSWYVVVGFVFNEEVEWIGIIVVFGFVVVCVFVELYDVGVGM